MDSFAIQGMGLVEQPVGMLVSPTAQVWERLKQQAEKEQ